MDNTFEQVIVKDNWGVKTYSFADGTPFPYEQGMRFMVRFPDGTHDVITLQVERRSTTINDMGNRYEQEYDDLRFFVLHRGLRLSASITSVEVERQAVPLPEESWTSKRPSEWTQEERDMVRSWITQ